MKYYGLELPIYPSDTEIASTPAELFEASNLQGSTFIRRIRASVFGADLSLRDTLGITDRELSRIAHLTDTEVVGHMWGLYELPEDVVNDPNYRNGVHEIIPQGYSLVAEVDKITGTRYLRHSRAEDVGQKIDEYKQDRSSRGQLYLRDINSTQFRSGRNKNSQTLPERFRRRIWLLDIEPLLSK